LAHSTFANMSMLANGQLVTPDGIVDGWLEISGQAITAIGPGDPPSQADHQLAGQWVVPGFVDIHVHGGAGVDYLSGGRKSAGQIIDVHRRHGTTTTLASLVTAERSTLTATLGSLAELVDDGLLGPTIAIEDSSRVDPWIVRQAQREAASCTERLAEFSRRDRPTSDG